MIITVTGKIGVGKTTVAAFFRSLGAVVIDADKIGHQILEQKREELLRLFGKRILKGRRIDRKVLGDLVFSNPKNLRLLNSLVHPQMILEIERQSAGKKIAVIDAALYKELRLSKISDLVILVTAKKEIVEKRMKSSLDRIRKFQAEPSSFDFLIQNNGSRKLLENAALRVWDNVSERARMGDRARKLG